MGKQDYGDVEDWYSVYYDLEATEYDEQLGEGSNAEKRIKQSGGKREKKKRNPRGD